MNATPGRYPAAPVWTIRRSAGWSDAFFARRSSACDRRSNAYRVIAAAGGPPENFDEALAATLPWLDERVSGPLSRLLARLCATGATVIPCGPLASAPLAGLPSLDRYVITQAPSATIQAVARQRAARLSQPRRLVAVAHPTGDLPAARAEARAIAARFAAGASDVRLLEGPDATAPAVAHAAAGATHLHFACHARGGLTEYGDAGVLLADRLVPLDDVGRLDLGQCRIAVASACQTAMPGVSELGDEALQVGTLLLSAGAACSVASLWSVDDLATGLLMVRFYDELTRHAPDQALHRAQRWLRELDPGGEAAFVAAHPHLEPVYRARLVDRATVRNTRGVTVDRLYAQPAAWAGFIVMGF